MGSIGQAFARESAYQEWLYAHGKKCVQTGLGTFRVVDDEDAIGHRCGGCGAWVTGSACPYCDRPVPAARATPDTKGER